MRESKTNGVSEEKSFEDALAQLESIVRALEAGDAGLDRSLALFEEGISLVRFCTDKLDMAEQKVRVLMQNGESYEEKEFLPSEREE